MQAGMDAMKERMRWCPPTGLLLALRDITLSVVARSPHARAYIETLCPFLAVHTRAEF